MILINLLSELIISYTDPFQSVCCYGLSCIPPSKFKNHQISVAFQKTSRFLITKRNISFLWLANKIGRKDWCVKNLDSPFTPMVNFKIWLPFASRAVTRVQPQIARSIWFLCTAGIRTHASNTWSSESVYPLNITIVVD